MSNTVAIASSHRTIGNAGSLSGTSTSRQGLLTHFVWARRVAEYVEHYNRVRLNGAIGYFTPADKLNGLSEVIFAEWDRKLEEARQRRQQARPAAREVA